jgi:tetratricopeptide (TPR) repeat protein
MARKKTRSELSREIAAESLDLKTSEEAAGNTLDVTAADWQGLGKSVAVLTAVLLLLFLAGAFCYGHYAGGMVASLDSGLGQVLAGRGTRLEAAGDYEGAIKCLQEAVALPFSSSKERTFVIKRLGALLITVGKDEDGVKRLEECAANPDHPISVFAPLVIALNRLKRHDDAVKYADIWLKEAEAQKLPPQIAEAYLSKGKALWEKGDAVGALQAFIEGEKIEPAGSNAFEAARLLHSVGRSTEAIPYLDRFIAGTNDTRTPEAQKLRVAITGVK